MAPNPRDGLVTLATCKPTIRKVADVGDWVVGNFPSPNNTVVAWAGRIARVVDIADYALEFPDRHDALHERGSDGELRRIKAKLTWYHQGADEQRKDKIGHALVFDVASTWYFGEAGQVLPEDLAHLAASYQGHRVNNRQPGDLERLQSWLAGIAPAGVHSEPRDGWAGPSGPVCNRKRAPKRSKPKRPC